VDQEIWCSPGRDLSQLEDAEDRSAIQRWAFDSSYQASTLQKISIQEQIIRLVSDIPEGPLT
jgi:hypothetical protein